MRRLDFGSFPSNPLAIAAALGVGICALACGGDVGGANGGVPSSGGAPSSNAASGGNGFSLAPSGGGASGTGGYPNLADVCNGIFSGQLCSIEQYDIGASMGVAPNCDVALTKSPPDPTRVNAVLDCQPVPQVPGNALDAGNVDGFAIDYDFSPAHLSFYGTFCTSLQTPGQHQLYVLGRCFSP